MVPCANCTKAAQPCEYGDSDKRKTPASKHYVASLEREIASLKDALREARSNQTLPESGAFPQEPQPTQPVPETPTDSDQISSRARQREARSGNVLLTSTSREYPSYQGPTSIYRLGPTIATDAAIGTDNNNMFPLYELISTGDADVNEILRAFFRWQYHQYMFIYREALLLDYLNHEYNGRYCSAALIYSICALGLVNQHDKRVYMASFLAKAYDELGTSNVFAVNLTTVQALLCLSFCELALGNVSKAWLLSGECCAACKITEPEI